MLVARQPRIERCAERIVFDRHLFGDEHGNHALAQVGVRRADHRRFRYSRYFIEPVLDFLRVDVEAAGDDQVLAAADQGHPALAVDAREVAGDEEAVVAHLLGRLLRQSPVARKQIRAANLQGAHFTRCHFDAVLAHGPHFDPGQRETDRARHTLPEQRIRGDHPGLRHAVALQDPVTGASLEVAEDGFRQRRRAGDEKPDAPAVRAAETRLRQQTRVERRHAHQHRRLRQQAAHFRGVEPRQEEDLRGVQEGRVQRHEQPVNVEDRQRVKQHVPRLEAPDLVQGEGVRGQVAVGDHRALGAPRGARRVADGGQVVVAAGLDRRVGIEGLRLLPQRVHADGARPFFGARLADTNRAAHDDPRRRVVDEERDLPLGVGRVQRHVHPAAAQHAQVEGHSLDRLRDLDQYPVPGLHAAPAQRRREPGRSAVEIAIRPRRPVPARGGAGWRQAGAIEGRLETLVE